MDKFDIFMLSTAGFILYMMAGFVIVIRCAHDRPWWQQMCVWFCWPGLGVAYAFVFLLTVPVKLLRLLCNDTS